eukprot:c28364_g1_i1 orf=61-249(-)
MAHSTIMTDLGGKSVMNENYQGSRRTLTQPTLWTYGLPNSMRPTTHTLITSKGVLLFKPYRE